MLQINAPTTYLSLQTPAWHSPPLSLRFAFFKGAAGEPRGLPVHLPSLSVPGTRPGGRLGQLNKTNSGPSALILSLDEAESGRAKAGRGVVLHSKPRLTVVRNSSQDIHR
jgi:hypothetical protein